MLERDIFVYNKEMEQFTLQCIVEAASIYDFKNNFDSYFGDTAYYTDLDL